MKKEEYNLYKAAKEMKDNDKSLYCKWGKKTKQKIDKYIDDKY